MTSLFWIIGATLAMSAVAWAGLVALALREEVLQRLLLYLLPFAAGNFIYIASSDLIPEIKEAESLPKAFGRFAAFLGGVLLLLVVRLAVHGHAQG